MRLRQNFLLPSLFICVCVVTLCCLGFVGSAAVYAKDLKIQTGF